MDDSTELTSLISLLFQGFQNLQFLSYSLVCLLLDMRPTYVWSYIVITVWYPDTHTEVCVHIQTLLSPFIHSTCKCP